MRKIMSLLAVLAAMACLLTACAEKTAAETTPETTQAETQPAETAPALPEATFEALQALLGMEDSEAAEQFGESQENWTEDKSTFIGRIYRVSLLEHPMNVFTSYSQENKVASVSAWVTDGSREVTEDEVHFWVEQVSSYAASEPIYDGTSSEGGSRNWKWKSGDTFVSLRWLGDIVTIEMVPAVGELR